MILKSSLESVCRMGPELSRISLRRAFQSVWEESVDSQVIARHSSLEELYVSLTVSVTTPFIKLNDA